MKRVLSLLIIFIILLQFVSAVNVVQVAPTPAPKSHWYDFMKQTWFWGLIILIILASIIVILSIFLIRWAIGFFKKRTNVWWSIKKKRQALAKMHSRYSDSNHWLRTKKNVPIRMVKQVGDKPIISSPIAYYRGDFTTHEGNLVISMNMVGDKKFFVYPNNSQLIIPDRDTIDIWQKDSTGVFVKKGTISNIPTAKDIIQWNPNEVLLYVESLSNTGEFYIPVVKTKDGKIIDLSLPIYSSMKEVVLNSYLYDQTEEYVKLSKKGLNINPYVNTAQKLGDNPQNVDIQNRNPQQP